MSFETFKNKVNGIIAKAGGNIKVRFTNSDGKYIAKCSDGVRIIGNSVSNCVRVEWGSGHKANATI